jgi:hypothetical protein
LPLYSITDIRREVSPSPLQGIEKGKRTREKGKSEMPIGCLTANSFIPGGKAHRMMSTDHVIRHHGL